MADGIPNFDDASAWEKVEGVNVFDAHEERAPDGTLLRKFGRGDLEEIARNCNARDEQGNLCPLTIGHTLDNPSEPVQPEHVGYARRFAVGWDYRLQRYVIRATYYLRKEDADRAKTYPRTSVELWGKDRFFDPIALLRRTPQRDLGQWTYSRNSHQEKLRYSMDDTTPVAAVPAVPAAAPAVPAVAQPELDPEHQEMAEKFWAHLSQKVPVLKYMCDQYAAQAAAPAVPAVPAAVPAVAGATNSLPSDPEKERMQKSQSDIEISRYQRENDDLKARMAALEKANLAREQEAKVARYERDLTGLIGQGYSFDLAEEVGDSKDMSPEQFAKHVERIKKRYSKRPVGDFIHTADEAPDETTNGGMPKNRLQECLKYHREHPEMTWKDAMEKAPRE